MSFLSFATFFVCFLTCDKQLIKQMKAEGLLCWTAFNITKQVMNLRGGDQGVNLYKPLLVFYIFLAFYFLNTYFLFFFFKQKGSL